MIVKVLRNGCYIGNLEALDRIEAGDEVPFDERDEIQVYEGEEIDLEELDPRVRYSLILNEIVEDPAPAKKKRRVSK